MERKKWLKTFLDLADNNRPSIEYRKKLRVMRIQLPELIKRIPKYRKELEAILASEAKEAEELRRVEENKRRRREEVKTRAEKRAASRLSGALRAITPSGSGIVEPELPGKCSKHGAGCDGSCGYTRTEDS